MYYFEEFNGETLFFFTMIKGSRKKVFFLMAVPLKGGG